MKRAHCFSRKISFKPLDMGYIATAEQPERQSAVKEAQAYDGSMNWCLTGTTRQECGRLARALQNLVRVRGQVKSFFLTRKPQH